MGEIITQTFSGFAETITGLGTGLKSAFMNLFYVDPSASELVISDLAKFGFVMLGFWMAVGLTYGIVAMIRSRR